MRPSLRRAVRLGASHVDMNRRLRMSTLMLLFQEMCIEHTEQLGMGRAMTLDRGLLWIVVSERIRIERMPEYDEVVELECSPGQTLHFFFPRNLVVRDSNGMVLIRAKAMWALMDIESRRMVDPGENGVVVQGEDLAEDLMPVMGITAPPMEKSVHREASYSLVDINGHMNNTAYMDIAMDVLGPEVQVREAAMAFRKEVPFGSSIDLGFCQSGGKWYFDCPNFSLKLTV